jgi:hypothetical protein
MTELDLAAIEARAAAATPGPWHWDPAFGTKNEVGHALALANDGGAEIVGAYNSHCCDFRMDPTVGDSDAEFIAASRADIAALVSEVKILRERIAAMIEVPF